MMGGYVFLLLLLLPVVYACLPESPDIAGGMACLVVLVTVVSAWVAFGWWAAALGLGVLGYAYALLIERQDRRRGRA